MKIQKFKIEKSFLNELYHYLFCLTGRIRIAMGFLSEKNHNDFHNFGVLNIYYNLVLTYLGEIEKLLSIEGDSIIVSKQVIENLNQYKKAIGKAEIEAQSIPNISLSIH